MIPKKPCFYCAVSAFCERNCCNLIDITTLIIDISDRLKEISSRDRVLSQYEYACMEKDIKAVAAYIKIVKVSTEHQLLTPTSAFISSSDRIHQSFMENIIFNLRNSFSVL